MIIQPLTEEGLAEVLRNLSAEDRAELHAAGLADAEAVFRGARVSSTLSGQVERDGRAVAIFGCTPAPNQGVGIPWMVATPEFRQRPRRAMELSRQVVGDMQRAYRTLVNWVHVRHTFAMRWLPAIGFTISEDPCGPGGEFRQFEWSADHV